ncbi:hypothetical protein BDB00DRAFT_852174 [Zychaea mexicana]|uniref:uncharacterized protein n=1 Tax=Zychaea mexicana TaxID=64656 RepID=UPI0022FEB201|nr:uncharacterized protein BDB00DRAFT_852174 [Zychaea mexicana]KAI9485001.1 hypothetical protein BDB00DRAFT_852174 [Zychaea mexicana]
MLRHQLLPYYFLPPFFCNFKMNPLLTKDHIETAFKLYRLFVKENRTTEEETEIFNNDDFIDFVSDCNYEAAVMKERFEATKASFDQALMTTDATADVATAIEQMELESASSNVVDAAADEAVASAVAEADEEMEADLAALEKELLDCMKAGQAQIAAKYGKRVEELLPHFLSLHYDAEDRGILKDDNRHAGYIVQQKSDEYKALMNDPELKADLIRATTEHNESIGATEQKTVQSAKLKLKLLIDCMGRNLVQLKRECGVETLCLFLPDKLTSKVVPVDAAGSDAGIAFLEKVEADQVEDVSFRLKEIFKSECYDFNRKAATETVPIDPETNNATETPPSPSSSSPTTIAADNRSSSSRGVKRPRLCSSFSSASNTIVNKIINSYSK